MNKVVRKTFFFPERYADISKTLEMLEKTGKVSFIIDEQKIIVRAK